MENHASSEQYLQTQKHLGLVIARREVIEFRSLARLLLNSPDVTRRDQAGSGSDARVVNRRYHRFRALFDRRERELVAGDNVSQLDELARRVTLVVKLHQHSLNETRISWFSASSLALSTTSDRYDTHAEAHCAIVTLHEK